MGRRGRKKQFKFDLNIKPEVYKSLGGVSLFVLALVTLVALVFPDYSLNKKIFNLVFGFFGISGYIIPFILFICSFLLFDFIPAKIKEPRVLIGLTLLSFFISPLFFAIKERFGGEYGQFVFETMINMVSIYATYPILFIGILIAFTVLFNISIDKVFSAILSKISFRMPNISLPAKKESTKKDKIEITSSPNLFSRDDSPEEAAEDFFAPVEENKHETIIEIKPVYTEPQEKIKRDLSVDLSTKKTIPSLPYSDKVWQLPPLDLLMDPPPYNPDNGDTVKNSKVIVDKLRSFQIDVEVKDVEIGPTFTRYVLAYPEGIRVSKISNLQYDLALALASSTGSVRIEAPIPGQTYIGIEVPNRNRALVGFKPLIVSDPMKALKSRLGIVMGKDVAGYTHVYDIAKMPHLLISGATNSGKSVFIHNIIFSILYRASPQEVKFIFIDPKRVELSFYQGIPHLYAPIVTDIEKAPVVFKWAVGEMMRRYKLFENARAKNIESYNEMSGFQALPYIVIIVDELAEIMIADPSSVEKSIIRLAQLARATGIHLILAAQRPSADVITGLIKANIPARVAFNVTGQVDSRVIIDQPGAEKLLGRGDMLFIPPDKPNATRIQAAYISEKEINNLVSFLLSQGVEPDYNPEIFEHEEDARGGNFGNGDTKSDPLYHDALETVVMSQKASASLLQRRLSVGYARAARLIDLLAENGIVGPAQGSKPREVLLDSLPNDNPLPILESDDDIKTPRVESLGDMG